VNYKIHIVYNCLGIWVLAVTLVASTCSPRKSFWIAISKSNSHLCYMLCILYYHLQVFVAALVKDKHERHLIMMEQCGGCVLVILFSSHDPPSGLSRPIYIVIQYLFNYCLYLFIAMVITVMSLAFHIRLFAQVIT